MAHNNSGTGNSGDNLSAVDIPSAEEFDASVGPDGELRYIRTGKFLSEFGKRHGGGAAAMMWFVWVSGVAPLAAMIAAPMIGDSGWSMEARAFALLACLGVFVLIHVVVLFLYYRLRFILMLAAGIAVLCVLASFAYALLDGLLLS